MVKHQGQSQVRQPMRCLLQSGMGSAGPHLPHGCHLHPTHGEAQQGAKGAPELRLHSGMTLCEVGEGPKWVSAPKEQREENGRQIPPVPQEKLLEARPHISTEGAMVGGAAAAVCELLLM